MNLEQARTNMVEQQIRTWEVLDQEVLDLLYVIPREEFVPQQHRALAFSDLELPLEKGTKAGAGERMWQPKLEARVLQELALKRTDRVLEVGTGSGYLTALMAYRAAEVCSVEIRTGLAADPAAGLSRSARRGRAHFRCGGRSPGDAGAPRHLHRPRRLEQRGSLRDGAAAAGERRAAPAFPLLTWNGSPQASSPRGSPTRAARSRFFSTCASRGNSKRRASRARP